MNYSVGNTIKYQTFCIYHRVVRVTAKEDDIKNGKPGFDGVLISSDNPSDTVGSSVWGYDSQIVEVVS